MKTTNTALTAAVVLAMGAAVPGQAAADDLLIDVASGALIEEGQAIQASGNAIADKYRVAERKKAAPKRKAATKR